MSWISFSESVLLLSLLVYCWLLPIFFVLFFVCFLFVCFCFLGEFLGTYFAEQYFVVMSSFAMCRSRGGQGVRNPPEKSQTYRVS